MQVPGKEEVERKAIAQSQLKVQDLSSYCNRARYESVNSQEPAASLKLSRPRYSPFISSKCHGTPRRPCSNSGVTADPRGPLASYPGRS